MVLRGMKKMNYGYTKTGRLNSENMRKQYQKRVFFEKNRFFGFRKITEERRKEIEKKAQDWVLQNKELNYDQKLFSLYHLLNKEYKITLNIEANDECYLFLILAFDPELKLLQISLEESNMEEIKRRFQEEFNTFYDSRLLQIEYHYNKQFPTIIDEFDKKM